MDLIQKCVQYIEEKRISQSKLATLVGIGESTMSRWIKGSYPNPESIDSKIEAFFEKENSRKGTTGIRDISFTMTSISEKVWGVADYCRLQRIIGTVYGDAGIGKTRTIEEWRKDKPDVVMVTSTPAFANPKPFLKLLARAFKTNRAGAVDDIYLDILDKLEGSDITIVIDEAQHLTRKTLELVRSINDSSNTAIILIGNEAIYSKMLGRQQAEFAQLFSRLSMRNHLLTDMFTKEDIESVFGNREDKVCNYLLQICRSKYGLRGAVNMFVNAQNNGDISLKGLKAMGGLMGISV